MIINYINMWMCVCVFSHVWLFVIPWTIACQAPLSMGFSQQKYWSGSYSLFPGIFSTQGLNPGLPHCCRQIDSYMTMSSGCSRTLLQQVLSLRPFHRWENRGLERLGSLSRIYKWRFSNLNHVCLMQKLMLLAVALSPQSENVSRSVMSNSLWFHGL